MSIHRPIGFDQVIGHEKVKSHFKARIEQGNLSRFIVLEGEEGLGKTTLAKLVAIALACPNHCFQCETCKKNIERVIAKNSNTSNIFSFRMSVEGGKEAVKEIVQQLRSNMLTQGNRIFILDEAHGMSSAAQDALLTDTEYLDDETYVILCTTDITSLSKPLLSRASVIHLKRLTRVEMAEVLRIEALRRQLSIENPQLAFSLITEYAEYKPRKALKVLESMGTNRRVMLSEIKDFVDLKEPEEFIDILRSIKGSITDGVSKVLSLQITPTTQKELLDFLEECLKSFRGIRIYKYDVQQIKSVTSVLKEDDILRAIYAFAKIQPFNNTTFLATYISLHEYFPKLMVGDNEILNREIEEKTKHEMEITPKRSTEVKRPATLDALLRAGKVVNDNHE